MRSRDRIAATLAMLLVATARGAQAQVDESLGRAFELEQNRHYAEAAASYRAALATPNAVAAVLGLERVYGELGWTDSLLVVVDSAIRAAPRNPTLRAVELRTLRGAGREAQARLAFDRWTIDAPGDAAPYREYARLLLQEGRAASADSVLRRAERALGGTRDIALELAQLRAAMGLWGASATSWRGAVAQSPYLLQAATFSLQPAPAAARADIRRVLAAPPVEAGARRILASLELGWGAPRDAWTALAAVPRSDSTLVAWREFADQAEALEEWPAAAEALSSIFAVTHQPAIGVRAAASALSNGDPTSALALASATAATLDSASQARQLVPLRVRALTLLSRPAEAQAVADAFHRWLPDEQAASLAREAAWGWVRAGDVQRARAALGSVGDDDIEGWLALYDGDLTTARQRLKHSTETSADIVTALALLSRTRAERAPRTGAAFLALARGDTVSALAALTDATRELPDAAPLLLSTAARLHSLRHEDARAIALWSTIVAAHAAAPEAAEAELEWGRTLRRRGELASAAAHFERLILTYPESALVPQARRELELARNGAQRS